MTEKSVREERTKKLNDKALETWLTKGFQELKVEEDEIVVGDKVPERRTHYRGVGGKVKEFKELFNARKPSKCPVCLKEHYDYSPRIKKYMIIGGVRCRDCKILQRKERSSLGYRYAANKNEYLRRVKDVLDLQTTNK